MNPGDMITPDNGTNDSTPEEQKPITPETVAENNTAAPKTSIEQKEETPAADDFQNNPFQDDPQAVSWSASEFIDHNKNAGWYLILAMGGGALTAVVYLATKDIITSAALVIATASFAIFASRKPRTLNYSLNSTGITVGQKLYPYTNFKSFSIKEEGAIASIDLMPLQRFMPGLTLYCPPDQEDKIIDALINYLPHEEHNPDMVDRFMHKIRF